MQEIAHTIWLGLTTASVLDQVNLVLNVAGVWLMVRRNLWAFPVGLVAVVVQGYLFFQTRFYADGALQIFFFVALAWGWWHWTHPTAEKKELPVTTMRARERLLWIGLVGAMTAVWALILARWTDARMPWRDAGIAALQVAGQVLQARKKLENWAFLTAANLVAIPAYWSAELAYTAFLYGIYLVLGLTGWRAWLRARARQEGGTVGRRDGELTGGARNG
ncbi:MAG TPA: nicotinamide riboside transporter PnuC [Opitutaceae bacterium]